MNYTIQEILANPTLLNKVPVDVLQNWTKQYPYVSLFHLYALKNKSNYQETDLHKTAFHFHNREKLYFLLRKKDDTIIQEIKIDNIADEIPKIPVIGREIKEVVVEEKIEEINIVEPEIKEEITEEELPVIQENIDNKVLTKLSPTEETTNKVDEELIIVTLKTMQQILLS